MKLHIHRSLLKSIGNDIEIRVYLPLKALLLEFGIITKITIVILPPKK
jgi:hypothetical protein